MSALPFLDQEIEALRAHYGETASEFDPDLEADLMDASPEDDVDLDVRRRYRYLLKLWSGRRSGESDVHTSHCCEVHGCKYSDEGCTVVTRRAPQADLCERCEDDLFERRAAEPRAEAYARSVAVRDPDGSSHILVDGRKLTLSRPEPEDGIPDSVLAKAQHEDLVRAIRCAYLAGV